MQRLFVTLALGLVIVLSAARAEEKKPADPKNRKMDVDKVIEAGPGVYNIEFDEKGRITSLVVVGSSRISTVLGAAKGKEVARQRASQMADAEFVKFLKSEVKVCEKTADETVLFLEGNEGNDKDAINESGKSIEKTSANFERSAQGMVRGLTILAVDVSEKDKAYHLVKRWRAKFADGAKGLAEREKPGAGDGTTKSKPVDKKIGDKKIIIND